MTHSTPYEENWADAHRDLRRNKQVKRWLLPLFAVGLSVAVTPAKTSTLPWGPGTMRQSQHNSTADVHEAPPLFPPPLASVPGGAIDEQGHAAVGSSLATRRMQRLPDSEEQALPHTPGTTMRQDSPTSIASMPAWGTTRRSVQTDGSALGSASKVMPSLHVPFTPVASNTASVTQPGGTDVPKRVAAETSGLVHGSASPRGADAMRAATPALGTPAPSASLPSSFLFPENAQAERVMRTPEPSASLLLALSLLALVGYTWWRERREKQHA